MYAGARRSARGQAQVAAQLLQRARAARVARLLLGALHAAELPLGAVPCLRGGESQCHVVLDLHGEVEAQLLVELSLHGVAQQEGAQAARESAVEAGKVHREPLVRRVRAA